MLLLYQEDPFFNTIECVCVYSKKRDLQHIFLGLVKRGSFAIDYAPIIFSIN